MKYFSTILFWIISAYHLYPQSDTSHLLKDVLVTASRQPVSLRESPKNIQVITSEEIRTTAARSVAEILMLAPSLDVRSRGPFGIQTDLGIRSGTFDQTLIMVDGIKMLDPQTGHHAMNLSISPLDIERIEIIPGGASRVFGQGAFAGAINIVSKSDKKPRLMTDLSTGEHGLIHLQGSANTLLKNGMQIKTSINALRHNGYMPNTDAESYSLDFKISKKLKNQAFLFNLSGNIRRFGAQNFYSIIYPLQHEFTKFFLGTFRYKYTGNLWIHTFTAAVREHHDRFELFREGRNHFTRTTDNYFILTSGDTARFLNGLYYRGHNFHLNRTISADWNSTLDMGFFGFLNIGYEFRSEGIWSNRLGFPNDRPVYMPFENQVLLNGYSSRVNNAIILDHHLPINSKWDIHYGVWSNFNTDLGRATMAGLEVLFKPKNSLSIWVSYNKAFRVPTFTDLFYNVGGAVGSIDLKPEYSHNYEAGVRTFQKKWKASLSLYIRDSKRLIDWIKYPDSSLITAANITEVLFFGAEGFLTHIFDPNPLKFKWSQLSFSWNELERKYKDFTSLYALDILQLKVTGSLSQQVLERLSFNYQIVYLKRTGNFVDMNNQIQNFPATFLLNLKVLYSLKKSEFYFEATNLLNQLHMDRGNIRLPGRWMRIGVIFKI